MLGALIGFGFLLMGLAFAGLVRPNAVQRWVAAMNPMGRYAVAVGVRVGVGLFLLAVAPEARWPVPTRVFGFVALAAALGVLVMGPTKLGHLVRWWAEKPAATVRFACSVALAVGLLLVIDAL